MACLEIRPTPQRGHGMERVARLGAGALQRGALWNPSDPAQAERPRTFGECQARGLGTATQPCPYLSCAYHTACDVDERVGSIHFNAPWQADPADGVPDLAPALERMAATCTLRVAEEGEQTLDEIAQTLGVTLERIRQIEVRALAALAEHTRDAYEDPALGAPGPLYPAPVIGSGDLLRILRRQPARAR